MSKDVIDLHWGLFVTRERVEILSYQNLIYFNIYKNIFNIIIDLTCMKRVGTVGNNLRSSLSIQKPLPYCYLTFLLSDGKRWWKIFTQIGKTKVRVWQEKDLDGGTFERTLIDCLYVENSYSHIVSRVLLELIHDIY